MLSHRVFGILIWLAATVGAVWLAAFDSGVPDAPAQVVPQEFRIAAAETGRLAEVRVAVGQQVLPGQVLARLDDTVLRREIAVAEARLRQSGAEPLASTAVMESDGYAAERSFQADADEAGRQLEAARQEQARQQAEASALRDEVARQRTLVGEGLVRAARAEELEVRLKMLDQTAATWPARLQLLLDRKQAALARLEEWRSRHNATSAPASRAARLQPLHDRVAEQREALHVLQSRLAASAIVAPAAGEVVSLHARIGDVASPGVPILILHGSGARLLVAYANERARLVTGVRAVARRRSAGREEFATVVRSVASNVVQIPPRFWSFPAMPQWGREVYLDWPDTAPLDAGEALDVKFLAGGAR